MTSPSERATGELPGDKVEYSVIGTWKKLTLAAKANTLGASTTSAHLGVSVSSTRIPQGMQLQKSRVCL